MSRINQIHQFRKTNLLIGFIFIFSMTSGCAAILPARKMDPERCVEAAIEKIDSLPEKKYLHSLDGQHILLEEFFKKCLNYQPYCSLYKKFYYWKNEVKEIISNSSMGPLIHKVRMYHRPLSECYLEDLDPGKTHGDVAEFYDEEGVFMGLAIYAGEGKYYVIHYSGYKRQLSLQI